MSTQDNSTVYSTVYSTICSTVFVEIFHSDKMPFMKLLQQNFLIYEPQFSHSDRKSVDGQHPGAKLSILQGEILS